MNISSLDNRLNVSNNPIKYSLESLNCTLLQFTLIPTLQPPQNKSTTLSASFGKKGSI